MGTPIALKGDKDDQGKAVTAEVTSTVKINGLQVALENSKLEDGKVIQSEFAVGVKIDGKRVATKNSKTDKNTTMTGASSGTVTVK
jgi:hypothetical protein